MKIQKFNENDNYVDSLLQGEQNDQKFSNIQTLLNFKKYNN